MTQCQVRKVRFVERLSQGIQGGISNVDSITYEVYGYFEFVRVNYVGGGYTVRNCSGNSHSAIFREVGRLLDGGYYDEIEFYEEIKNDSTRHQERV